ncbi:MAG TPA: hypothetical protein PLM24_02835 [Methanothrix sp.]|nr:hypothetical protein [Methanothrix sp.]HPJ84039.1 hypothetical protein [Methanothrix sp.]HPR66052.1 hypothetical protein [Methanothrix sp.]
MRITIIYDNASLREDLRADWGFSALVEARGRRILFDTGAKDQKHQGVVPSSSPTPRNAEVVRVEKPGEIHPHR